MQVTPVLLLSICACALVAAFPAPELTDAQLEQVLYNPTTIKMYIKCATMEGPCDAVGKRMRTLAPLVLRGACPQCSARETRQIRRTLAFIQRNYPWEWAKIVRRFG
ncbi:ejaculatory bulb-specific protein 3-like [Cydia strobilella]|uniref:ejaculatory bulb-specific protein 3-like n=1 Tax=Cydia strobilella TaxID=1100964 RepID=UPI0030076824